MQQTKVKKRTILVTGGTGYIGSKFLDSSIVNAFDIVATTRLDSVDLGKKAITFERGDLKDKNFVGQLFNKYEFDYIFHMAAMEYDPIAWNVREDYKNNCEPLIHILNSLQEKKSDAKLIFLSSINVFGSTRERIVTETTQPIPESFWSSHKLLCHDYCRYFSARFGVKSNILMLPNIYGFVGNLALTKRMAVNRIIQDAILKKEVTLYSNADIKRSFLHVDDVVTALWAATKLKEWQASKYCVSGASCHSFRDLFQILQTVIRGLECINNHRDLSKFEMRDYRVSARSFSSKTGWTAKGTFENNVIKTYFAMLQSVAK